MIQLYDFPLSGNAHKVRLALSLLGIEHEIKHVNLGQGEHKSESYLSINPFGQVPVLDDDGFVLRDSNAIISYLARRYAPSWFPHDARASAQIIEWLGVANKELLDGPGAARLVNVFGAALDHESAIDKSHALLSIMEQRLTGRDWIAVDSPSVADISLYSYVAHAPEGDVSLETYPHVRRWLIRIEALPGFVDMPKSATGLAA